MMDTIKAKTGYRVVGIKRDCPYFSIASWWFTEEECNHLRAVLDGDKFIMVACLIDYADFKKEQESNEMFHLCEHFTTQKGNHYAYWRDEETDTDYITKIE